MRRRVVQLGPDLRLWGGPGQDIFRGDVRCQTHFFRGGKGGGGVARLHLVGGPFWWGPLGMCPVCPALNPVLSPTIEIHNIDIAFKYLKLSAQPYGQPNAKYVHFCTCTRYLMCT